MKYYLVDYYDVYDNHLVYRSNVRDYVFEKIFNPCVVSWRLYVGSIRNGLFVSEGLLSRSATYMGV